MSGVCRDREGAVRGEEEIGCGGQVGSVDEEVGVELVEALDGAALAQQLLQGWEMVAGGRRRKHRKARRSDGQFAFVRCWGKPQPMGRE
jgi:hypothetical protein